jgi:hypothetical protein
MYGVASPYSGPRTVTIYRGQRSWHPSMTVTVSSARRGLTPPNFITSLRNLFRLAIQGSAQRNPTARKQLQTLLYYAQQSAFMNPFVSCTFDYAIARSFANAGNQSGYVLTITGPWYDGVDYEFVRTTFGLYHFGYDYLREFGVPYDVSVNSTPFLVVKVDRVADALSRPKPVYP